jgi:mannose-6-phosphate isomerase-like protein (cupin superfamily)
MAATHPLHVPVLLNAQGKDASVLNKQENNSPQAAENPPRAAASTAEEPLIDTERAKSVRMITDTEGQAVWAMGILVILKALGTETGGTYSCFEDLVHAGAGTPLHMHTKEEETWYMLEGSLEWTVGDKTFTAEKGSFVNTPRNVPHRFANKTDQPAKMLLSYAPGGFEKWFLEIGKPATDRMAKPPEITAEEIKKAVVAAEKYGVKFIPQKM